MYICYAMYRIYILTQQYEQFNHDELELLEDSVRYLIGCLDPEAAYLYADLAPLLAKIESMTNDNGREKRPTKDESGKLV